MQNVTPLKTNMSPENQWLEDVFPTEIAPFLGDMLVLGGVIVRALDLHIHQVVTPFDFGLINISSFKPPAPWPKTLAAFTNNNNNNKVRKWLFSQKTAHLPLLCQAATLGHRLLTQVTSRAPLAIRCFNHLPFWSTRHEEQKSLSVFHVNKNL